LSRRTLGELDAMAGVTGESRNALADRLLGEAVRTETHPLIRYQTGAAGRRRPLLVGTRLYVHQMIETLRGSDDDVDETSDYLGLRAEQVRAALAYYADFADEVDEDAAVTRELECDERARWERQQRALGRAGSPLLARHHRTASRRVRPKGEHS
jgi:uncharacterized protein (DUF433 family)